MAGIAGIRGADNGELGTMLNRIKHRGPHEVWINQTGDISLGCCELNVGGVSKDGSHHVSDGKSAVILDGRIYNPETASMTDAEAVLYFYDKFGSQFAKKLDGDFACAIADNSKLMLARDAVGVKPLYYGHNDGRLCLLPGTGISKIYFSGC